MNRSLRILHLEDDPYDAELIRETLAEEGSTHTIINVDDQESFLAAIEQGPLDVIIADFALPSFNGQTALTIAQQKCPEVPFIFVSGAIGEERAIESLKQGATDYVLKHRLSGLLPAIQRALREVEERQQRQQAVASLAIRARQQAAVAALGQLALSNTPIPQLMNETATLVAQAVDVPYSYILQLVPEKNILQLVAGVGWQGSLALTGETTVAMDMSSQAGYTLLIQEPVIVTDLRSETRFTAAPIIKNHKIISGLTIIVPGETQPFGVLGAFTDQSYAFTEDDVYFLQSMAHVLATAIERKQREEQLRQSRNQLSAILEGITEGITVQKPDGSLIYANEMAAQLSGYPSVQAFLDAPVTEITQKFELRNEAGERFPPSELPGRQALKGKASSDVLVRFRAIGSGAEHWSVMSATPIFDEQGQVQFAVNIFRDVTERTRLYQTEKEARQQAEAIALRIASLQVVTASLTEALTPLQVAQVVEEQTIAVVGAKAAATFLLRETPSEQMLEVLHSIGYPEHRVAPLRQLTIDTPYPVAAAVRTSQPVFLPSRKAAQEKFSVFAERATPEHQAWAALPLLIEGRVIGAIVLSFDKEQSFAAEEQGFMFSLARQCAQALERARLYEAERLARQLAEEAAERTAGLQRVTAALSQALTPIQVAQLVVEQGVAVLGAEAGSVVVLNERESRLDILYAGGYGSTMVQQWHHFPLDAPVPIADVVRTGQPIFLESVAAALAQYPAMEPGINETGNQAWATIPLWVEGRSVGALGLSFIQPQIFDEDDQTFMLALGRQCAQALERARLYEAERMARAEAELARHRLEFLTEASGILATSLDYHWSLNKVAQLVVPHIADWCIILLTREDAPEAALDLVALFHHNSESVAWATNLIHRGMVPDFSSNIAHIIRSGHSELYRDFPTAVLATQDNALNRDILQRSSVQSLMVIPLVARERIMGGMILATAESGRFFDEDDVSLVEDLGHRAALAVDNARLYWQATQLNEALEQRVAQRTEQLRRLTQQVVTAQEEERRRLSRELHDEAGQALTALRISLGLIQDDLPGDLVTLKQRVGEAVALTREAMDQIRNLAHDLRPPSLDTVGLNLTLEGFCREFAQRTQLNIAYSGTHLPSLPELVSTTFYRLLQESLTNVARHARAQQVQVTLSYLENKLTLLVADDGEGFELEQVSTNHSRGIGLLGMQERLELLNGWLEIDSKPGHGTRLIASVTL